MEGAEMPGSWRTIVPIDGGIFQKPVVVFPEVDEDENASQDRYEDKCS